MNRSSPPRGIREFINGKWLAQTPSGTQRYATQVVGALAASDPGRRMTLVLPRDAQVPPWAEPFDVVRSRLHGTLFEQLALPWITRQGHLYSLAGPAPLLKRDQTVVMHDAMPFRFPGTFRRAFVVWYRLLYTVLARRAARVLTVSRFSRSELAQVLRVPADRFELAPCGSDHVREPAGGEDEFAFPRGAFALLVGNQAPHKNVPATLGALADARVPVVVVGGEQRQVFRTSSSTTVHDDVRFLGRIDDETLERLYAAAGVLVAPSRYEGFGIPVVEAGRLGCPSVYARGSALTEVAGDGGLGFDPDDMTACVRLVRRVLEDPAEREDLARRARVNARRYTWAGTAQTVFGGRAPDASSRGADAEAVPGRPRAVRVLHVTETFSAGTGVAVIGFARGTQGQGIESHLVAQDRRSGLLDELGTDSPFATATILPSGVTALLRGVRRAVATIQPDVVHVHSSIAGAAVRPLLAATHPRLPVVYSPHCFAFERRDVPVAQRRAFRLAERLLARTTRAYICVSPHEASLARDLGGGALVEHLVNAFDVETAKNADDHLLAPGEVSQEPERIVSVGRVTPQKDPTMFADVVAALRRAGRSVDATWIGGGDDTAGSSALDRADVRITGWLPASKVPGVLTEQSLYLHTATWEAAVPIAVMDAMRAGLAVIVRRTNAYRDMLPDAWQFDDVPGAVRLASELADPSVRRPRLEEQFTLLRSFADRGPRAVLAAVYRDVTGGHGRG